EDRATLSRPDPLADPRRDDERDESGSGELCPAGREHGLQAALPEQIGDGDPDDEDGHRGQDERRRAQPYSRLNLRNRHRNSSTPVVLSMATARGTPSVEPSAARRQPAP